MRSCDEIQLELDEVNAAISATLKGQKYSFDTGQDRTMLERPNLSELRKLKESLLSELSLCRMKESGCQVTSGTTDRGLFH
jgi:hypothetical protein